MSHKRVNVKFKISIAKYTFLSFLAKHQELYVCIIKSAHPCILEKVNIGLFFLKLVGKHFYSHKKKSRCIDTAFNIYLSKFEQSFFI